MSQRAALRWGALAAACAAVWAPMRMEVPPAVTLYEVTATGLQRHHGDLLVAQRMDSPLPVAAQVVLAPVCLLGEWVTRLTPRQLAAAALLVALFIAAAQGRQGGWSMVSSGSAALALTAQVVAALAYLTTFWGGFVSVQVVRQPPRGRLLVANLHSHSTREHGWLTPAQVVRWHAQRGFNAVSVTDRDAIDSSLDAMQSVADGRAPEVVAVPGEEFKGDLHLLLLGVTESFSPAEGDARAAIQWTREHGGVSILAHPWSSHRSAAELKSLGADGAEWFNGVILGETEWLQQFTDGWTGMGAVDLKFGAAAHVWNVLETADATPGGVIEAVNAGRVRTFTDIGEPLRPSQWRQPPLVLMRSIAVQCGAALMALTRAQRLGLTMWLVAFCWLTRRRQSPPHPTRRCLSCRTAVVAIAWLALTVIIGACTVSWSVQRALVALLPWQALTIWVILDGVAWLGWRRVDRGRAQTEMK